MNIEVCTKRRNLKRGSVTVYAMYFGVSLILLVTALINGAQTILVRNGANALGDLWASSILGEYDKELYRRYGILAYYGDEGTVKNKLEFYADYTFGDKRYASCHVKGVELYDYSLITPENVMKQIRKETLKEMAEGLLSGRDEGPVRYDNGEGEAGSGRLIDSALAEGLPSYGKTSSLSIDYAKELIEKLTSLESIVTEGTDSFILNKYIKNNFRNVYFATPEESTYLYGEQEYILSGRNTDEANRKSARNKIIALREVLNMVYLESNPELRDACIAAGEVITLGQGGPAAGHAIMAAWALAESINDYELLIHGKPVSFFKNESCWAIDLDSVLENESRGCVDTGYGIGDDYTDYLMYLLYLTGENTKILRMLDLIELNLRETYYGGLRLQDYYVGVRYSLNANGEEYSFTDVYER